MPSPVYFGQKVASSGSVIFISLPSGTLANNSSRAFTRLFSLSGPLDHRRDLIQVFADRAPRHANIELVLQVKPQCGSGAESLGQSQCSIGGNAGFFIGQALNAGSRNATDLRQRSS